MADVLAKVKIIMMDKSSAPSDTITLGPDLGYDASNAQVAVDAINSEFGTTITVDQVLNFNTIGEVGNYVESIVNN
jgi:acyl carrier protein